MNNKLIALVSTVASGASAFRAFIFATEAVESEDTLEKVLLGTAAAVSGVSSIVFGSAAIDLLRAPQIDDTTTQSSVARKPDVEEEKVVIDSTAE